MVHQPTRKYRFRLHPGIKPTRDSLSGEATDMGGTTLSRTVDIRRDPRTKLFKVEIDALVDPLNSLNDRAGTPVTLINGIPARTARRALQLIQDTGQYDRAVEWAIDPNAYRKR